ncbi:TonB-dependent receptor plug domain-containing protein [Komagataeibacter rhaeticus]|nr:TonB-dependent receptor plug domain-containing protein [Komagataeibacter rhaeticus]
MKRQHAPEATSSITAAAIAQKLTIASPIQLAATLPGANVGMSDAYGLSIRNDISVRGYDETEMGWVVEGVPGIDQAYLLPYSETWADNENLSDVTLIASTSRINDPVQSASGGEMIETVRDPSNKMGATCPTPTGPIAGTGSSRVMTAVTSATPVSRCSRPIPTRQRTYSRAAGAAARTMSISSCRRTGVTLAGPPCSYPIRTGPMPAAALTRWRHGRRRTRRATISRSGTMPRPMLRERPRITGKTTSTDVQTS